MNSTIYIPHNSKKGNKLIHLVKLKITLRSQLLQNSTNKLYPIRQMHTQTHANIQGNSTEIRKSAPRVSSKPLRKRSANKPRINSV